MKKDRRSIQILEILRQDARKPISDISKTIAYNRSKVFRKMKYINKHFVKKYTSIIDFKKLDYNIRVRYLLNSNNKRLLNYLSNKPNINSIVSIKGQYNYYIEAFFKNLAHFNEFDEKLNKLCNKKREHFIVEEIKEEGFKNVFA